MKSFDIAFAITDTEEIPYASILEWAAKGGDINEVVRGNALMKIGEYLADYRISLERQRAEDLKLVDPAKIDTLIAEAKAEAAKVAEVPPVEEEISQ